MRVDRPSGFEVSRAVALRVVEGNHISDDASADVLIRRIA